MTTPPCPRLIEVALPIREISAESVRDKSLRHGHISTLHLWWARRPLAASRAVVFASLVPDPDNPNCPDEFRQAVSRLLKEKIPYALQFVTSGSQRIPDPDPYKPYPDWPDALRNRLLMFIAKWSRTALEFEKGKKSDPPKPAELLDDRSLVKWETSNPENAQGQEVLRIARELIKSAHDGNMPTVLDPFAGGGAIPLEAGRLGCQAIANDYNPVAYLILRATCEFPQKYGKPGKRKAISEEFGRRSEYLKEVPNVLAHDVKYWATWILLRAKEKIGHLYPPGKDGKSIVGYLWARTAPCSNPSCRGEIPLLRSLLICNKSNKRAALTMGIDKTQKTVRFGIAKDKDIKITDGTMVNRGSARCPFCEQITSNDALIRAGQGATMDERLVAVIFEMDSGKDYRLPEDSEIATFIEAKQLSESCERPNELMPHFRNINLDLYGLYTWGSLFNPRQLVAMQTFIACLHEVLEAMKNESFDDAYRQAVGVYLGLWVSRIAQRSSNVGIWHTSRETLEHPFGRQAIPMTWDYPEANPFSESTGGAEGGIDWMLRVIAHESNHSVPVKANHGDSSHLPFKDKSLDLVVTDPPYFDAIAYADLSDYFYVWLKRAIQDVIPEAFSTPLTPKKDEATALKHRHGGNAENADTHFKTKLADVFVESHRLLKNDGIVSIMFAHQSTKAWTALIDAIFKARLTINATWPIDTELTTALKASMSALSSSVTVSCRPRETGSAASFKDVRREIEKVVRESVKRFWDYGFRGADLIVACYGPAVGVFGKYERVEKADGTPVQIPELLELARTAARDAIAGEFRADNLSTLYYVWTNLYGVSEQDWDDARLVVQIGGDTDNAMEVARNHGIFVVNGSKCRLALLADRVGRRGLGIDANPPLIDALHNSMLLWKDEKRSDLVTYLNQRGLLEDGPFWKLVQALFEVLPRDLEDWKITSALLGERETLRIEAKRKASRSTDLFSQ